MRLLKFSIMDKFIIKEETFSPYKKNQAILEAKINTSQYVYGDKKEPYAYTNFQTAQSMLKHVYNALKATTYTRRNTRTRLDAGYSVVHITDGMDYTTHPDGSIDAIEVRGILNDKVALRYSIKYLTESK